MKNMRESRRIQPVRAAGKSEMKRKEKKGDLTRGPVGKQILRFALPLLGASLIQQLYNTVDLLFVGRLLGTEATAAVGASSLLTNCIVGFFTGISIGTGVVISLAVGEENSKKIRDGVHTSQGLAVIGGFVLMFLGLLLSRRILIWMNTPGEILETGLVYIRIYLLGMIPLFLYNMNAGIIRACGDSRTPMLFQILGAVLNVALDWFSMTYLGMGVAGAAWGTFFSQLLAALCSVGYLMRQTNAFRLELRKIRISGGLTKQILQIGVPAGLQNLVITISNIFVQTAINGLGVNVIAAFTAYFKVELLLYLPIVAFGQAATTFVGQNLGAGQIRRIRKGVKVCTGMGIIYTLGMAALLLFVLGRPVFGLFQSEKAVIDIGIRIIRVTFPFYWLYVILEVCADALRGMGRSVPPMVIILSCMCIFRTILLLLFGHVWGTVEAVAAVYPCAWLAAAICLGGCWRKKSSEPGR